MKFNELRQPYLEEFEGGSGATEPTEPITPAEPPAEPTPTPGIKVKYNHEELELPYEEAVAHIQKGMNYDKAVERARQEAKDLYIAEQYAGQLWKGKPITTEAELKQAIKEQKAEDEIRQKYAYLDEEIVNEIIAGKQFREKFEAKEQENARERKEREQSEAHAAEKEKDRIEFLGLFQKENGRAWNEQDTLPQEVINYLKQGKTLADSYARHLVDVYKSKVSAQEVNQKNADSSTGSVTGNGNPTDGFITAETFEANKHDQSWIQKNYNRLMESRFKW